MDANVEAEDINSFDEFKGNVFAVIDKLNRRFSDRNKKTMRVLYCGIDALTPTSENFLNQDIAEFAREYSSMVTVDFLPAEINNFRQMLKRRKESESAIWQGPETLELQGYVHRLRDAFTEMDKLVTKLTIIACTLPISTASCERSFSTLRIVKSYLRTSIWGTTDWTI